MTNILDKIMHNGTEYDLPEWIPSWWTDWQFLGKVSGDTAWADAPVTSVNSKTWAVTLDADDISDSATTNKFVTASDKTTWSGKQDALATQTAYTTKWTATKVPTISTNTLWQVTAITETDITFPVTSVWWSTGAVWLKTVNGSSLIWTGNISAWWITITKIATISANNQQTISGLGSYKIIVVAPVGSGNSCSTVCFPPTTDVLSASGSKWLFGAEMYSEYSWSLRYYGVSFQTTGSSKSWSSMDVSNSTFWSIIIYWIS